MDKSLLTDEYVTNVLKDEARNSSLKYSTLGLDAFRSSKNAGPARKPNTRFLSHLLRDTDAHNAALLVKEQREAKERRQSQRERGQYIQSSREDKFGLRHGDSERPHKRRRTDDGRHDDNSAQRSRSRFRSRSPRPSEGRRRHHRSRSRDSKRHRRHHGSEDEGDDRIRHSESRQVKQNRQDRLDRLDSRHKGQHRRQHERRHQQDRRRERSPSQASQSDPLEAIVGPAPPPKVRIRGRGAHATSGAMDARFEPGYNPKEDVRANSGDEDDWEMALEALRDRQKWNQQGADRLKAAGFTDSQIDQWSRSGGERDESDVRWAKKGEGREWDRGKVVGHDNEIELRPSWAGWRST